MDAVSLHLFETPPEIPDPDSPATERAPLRPLYYLENFRAAMDSLLIRYADLLRPEGEGAGDKQP